MKWIFLFTLCLFSLGFPSCHKKAILEQPENRDTFCENYYKYISDHFRPDSLGIYSRNNLFPLKKEEQTVRYINEIINQCLIGKNKDEIITIFGKPSYSTKRRIDYYFNNQYSGHGKDAKSSNISNCVRLRIYFDDKGVITGIPAILNESGQKY